MNQLNKRFYTTILLSLWIIIISSVSSYVGDYESPYQTWFVAFSLPLWSLIFIGIWYDLGRFLFGNTIDSRHSDTPVWIRATTFITWMSLAFTFIIWEHIEIGEISMLPMTAILGLPLQRWLIQDWSKPEALTRNELFTLLIWSLTSFVVYWALKFVWILLRVRILESMSDGIVFYIQ